MSEEATTPGEWAKQYGEAPANPRTPRELRLLRDLDGHVHTPNGWMRGARYDLLRKTLPELNYPERSTIPLMSDLSDDDLQAWYSGAHAVGPRKSRSV